MAKARFETELIEGHKGVTVVMVPFDPALVWKQPPVRLEGRRHGWLVTGTLNGVPFDGYVGERWGNFFIQVDDELRAAAKARVGATVAVEVDTTSSAQALQKARALSLLTTQPKTARADAVELPVEKPKRGAKSPTRRPRG